MISVCKVYASWDRRGRVVIVLQLVLQLSNVVNSNSAHGKVYSIQHYVTKCVSDLRQVSGFLRGTPVSPTNKTDRHDITHILLKLALNTIILTLTLYHLALHIIVHTLQGFSFVVYTV